MPGAVAAAMMAGAGAGAMMADRRREREGAELAAWAPIPAAAEGVQPDAGASTASRKEVGLRTGGGGGGGRRREADEGLAIFQGVCSLVLQDDLNDVI